jgi:urease accessory protein
MGAASPRITAADFVTPPEFAGLSLARHGGGQVGGVRLDLAPGRGGTVLAGCYQQVPVRVLPPFTFPGEPAALLYLLNPTAGLMDGDGHLVEVVARSGSRTLVTGQSANRIHPAVAAFAAQRWRVSVEADAALVVLPGPTIPFRGCRYYQRAEIELAATARLVWGDVWLPGRYARAGLSEWFQFDRIVQDLSVARLGRVVFRERFAWCGPWDEEAARWHLGGARAAGSLYLTGTVAPHSVQAGPDCDLAVLPTEAGDTCVRWCGPPPAVIRAVTSTALAVAGGWTGGEAAPPWLLASHHLAANHWFFV